jgi:hypothetical protein
MTADTTSVTHISACIKLLCISHTKIQMAEFHRSVYSTGSLHVKPTYEQAPVVRKYITHVVISTNVNSSGPKHVGEWNQPKPECLINYTVLEQLLLYTPYLLHKHFSPFLNPSSLYLSYLHPAPFLTCYLTCILLSTSGEIPSRSVFLNVVLALPRMKCQYHFMGLY